MQAPLSRTASGKLFRRGSFTALQTVVPCTTLSALAGNAVDNFGEPQGEPHELNFHTHSSIAEGAGLAHDAGNLLGALGLYCELLALPGVLRDEHRHYADELQMLSGRSWTLIDRLLNPRTTGRPRGSATGEPEEEATEQVVIPHVIEQCRGLLESIARRAVEVAYEAGTSARVPVSCEALERILVNLTKNAAEASAGKGSIRLRVSCLRARPGRAAGAAASDRIVLSVEDKGCGMSTAAVKVLMGENRMAPEGGRGIGFRVVRELVGASGGQLRLKSRSGCEASGTTVEITWAVAEGSGAEEARTRSRRSPAERGPLMLVASNRKVEEISCQV